jgi:hypothetical protein
MTLTGAPLDATDPLPPLLVDAAVALPALLEVLELELPQPAITPATSIANAISGRLMDLRITTALLSSRKRRRL